MCISKVLGWAIGQGTSRGMWGAPFRTSVGLASKSDESTSGGMGGAQNFHGWYGCSEVRNVSKATSKEHEGFGKGTYTGTLGSHEAPLIQDLPVLKRYDYELWQSHFLKCPKIYT